jgi:Zn-dependent M28 family amino/carboxypeptidase
MGKSSLDQIAESVARSQGRTLRTDQFPDRGYFYRSDQFSFARVGVPTLNFDEGTDVIGWSVDWGRQQVEDWEGTSITNPQISSTTVGISMASSKMRSWPCC